MTTRGAVAFALVALLAPDPGLTEMAETDLKAPRVGFAAELYARNCQGCHGHKGVTVPEVPTLKDRAGWFLHTAEGRRYLVQVPGVALALVSDEELATLLNWMLEYYSREELPPDWQPYTPDEVRTLRRRPLANVSKTRHKVVSGLVRDGIIPDAKALHFGAGPERGDP